MAEEARTALPTIVPMIAYEDGAAALDWLARAFGFRERMRMADDDGTIMHAEMEVGDGVIMIATPTPDYRGPKRHAETCADSAAWRQVPYVIDGWLVQVDDVEAHHARARDAGATILSEPEEADGETRYRAEDPEGHRWMFIQRA